MDSILKPLYYAVSWVMTVVHSALGYVLGKESHESLKWTFVDRRTCGHHPRSSHSTFCEADQEPESDDCSAAKDERDSKASQGRSSEAI